MENNISNIENRPPAYMINDLLRMIQANSDEIIDDFGIIDNTFVMLEEIEKMGVDEFSLRSKLSLPRKLYKYFPNKWIFEGSAKKPVNYSLLSLNNNTVFLQSPGLFDDVYDSNINIDWLVFARVRLHEYLLRCCISELSEDSPLENLSRRLAEAFCNEWNDKNSLENVFSYSTENETAILSNRLFTMTTENAVLSGKSDNWEEAIKEALTKEYQDYIYNLRNTFRISCFTTSPYQQLMWGGDYADRHTGFCVEYDIDPDNEDFKSLYFNLFPVVYCKSRPDVSEFLAKNKDGFTKERHWHYLFHGFLRKSIDWLYQNEWRLLKVFERGTTNYNVPFFHITKVFIGCRMDREQRSEIIDICKNKQIPYVIVRPARLRFEMEECDGACEKCSRSHMKG